MLIEYIFIMYRCQISLFLYSENVYLIKIPIILQYSTLYHFKASN